MAETHAPVQAITKGPKYHWFGYYDKLETDPSERYVLGMEVAFEGRSPKANDVIKIGMVDLEDNDRWNELGESRAWCWQQGCMLQWLPGSNSKILWNDRQGNEFVCHIYDITSRKKRTLPMPVYTVSPDGRTALTTDFRRINDMRPGYGYTGVPDPNKDLLTPNNTGVWRVNLETGDFDLILSVSEIARIPYPHEDLSNAKHYFNHLLVSPDGQRFVFLHRWRLGNEGFHTRMFSAAMDGSDTRIVDDSGNTSHFYWRDPEHILIFTKPHENAPAFHLFNERTGEAELVIDDQKNGHCLYLPKNEWILNDTYPSGKERLQNLYLYHVPTGQRYPLGSFHSPQDYEGEWRCDLHARFSPKGETVIMDSAHGGNGRQLYIINISSILKKFG